MQPYAWDLASAPAARWGFAARGSKPRLASHAPPASSPWTLQAASIERRFTRDDLGLLMKKLAGKPDYELAA